MTRNTQSIHRGLRLQPKKGGRGGEVEKMGMQRQIDTVHENPDFKSFNPFRTSKITFVSNKISKDTSLSSDPCNHPQSNTPPLMILPILK